MNARHSWVGAMALALVLIPATYALAQPGFSDQAPAPGEDGGGYGGPGMHMRMMAGRGPFAGLDLSDAQKAKLEELREKGRAEGMTLRKQLMRLRNQMRGEMLQDKPDRRKIVTLAEQIGGVRTKLGVHRAEQHLAMLDVLTPAQRDQWLTRPHRGQRGPGGAHGRGMGQGGHGPRGMRGGPGGS